MNIYLIVAVIAYLLGSIPFGYILVRVFRGEDVRQVGSGNIGATNVARKAPGLGIATLVLDAGKGFAAVWIAHALAVNHPKDLVLCGVWSDFACSWPASFAIGVYLAPTLAALFAVLGHLFPVWLKFRGGKGVAVGVGGFLAVAPRAVLVVLGIFVLVVLITRYVSLGSTLATAAFPVVIWICNGKAVPPVIFAMIVLTSALIVVKHQRNIRRLLTGTESRFGAAAR